MIDNASLKSKNIEKKVSSSCGKSHWFIML